MSYRVTDTKETTTMTQAGSTVAMYRVWLVTDRGATGQVDVPKASWSKEKLGPILDAKAEELDLAFVLTE